MVCRMRDAEQPAADASARAESPPGEQVPAVDIGCMFDLGLTPVCVLSLERPTLKVGASSSMTR